MFIKVHVAFIHEFFSPSCLYKEYYFQLKDRLSKRRDRLTPFCLITREPDFCRICGFRRKLRDIMFFHFKQKKVHINGLDFRQKCKNPIFDPFLPQNGETRFFPKNPAPLRFVVYGSLTSCKKSKRSYDPIPKKIPNGQRERRERRGQLQFHRSLRSERACDQ